MPRRRNKPRTDDLTRRYKAGAFGAPEGERDAGLDVAAAGREDFGQRSKHQQKNKTAATALKRAEDRPDRFAHLPAGRVVQVFSLYIEVGDVEQVRGAECEAREGVDGEDGSRSADPALRTPHPALPTYLCTIRKTLSRARDTQVCVNDRVRVLATGGTGTDVAGRKLPEGVIEQIEPRRTVLTRADSFKGRNEHPVVANADQLLVVVARSHPRPKWGLVDRLIVAARAGGLEPVVCLNKVDLDDDTGVGAEHVRPDYVDAYDEDDLFGDLARLVAPSAATARTLTDAEIAGDADPAAPPPARVTVPRPAPLDALAHYESVGVRTLRTSAETGVGIDDLRAALAGRTTVLAGHSGVGKSSLIRAAFDTVDLPSDLTGLRVSEVSGVTNKGMHTTTGGRVYPLGDDPADGSVVDTPGVKVFGLWRVAPDDLDQHYPDVANGTAPPWRRASYDRLRESLESGPGE